MINIHFNIKSPGSKEFNILKSWVGNTPFINKFWELEIYSEPYIISVDLIITSKQDHSGFDIGLGLLGYCIYFKFYDNRHWDYKKNCYETHHESLKDEN